MKALWILPAVAMAFGCAYMKSNTHSISHMTTNGVEIVEQDTHSRAWTFMDANSSLARFRNGSDKTTLGTNVISAGTYASGINENSSSVGVSNIVAAAINLAIQAAAAAK
jgi:hypothetical protein